VEKIDNHLHHLSQLLAEIIFTTTSTDLPSIGWTVLAGAYTITIKASGAGAPGIPAITTSTSGGRGGGGSGQVGNITVPVAEGMVLDISLGAVTPGATIDLT